ncbi:MAG: hypothetical protein RJA44_1238 [Pseudomonadota bacterium]
MLLQNLMMSPEFSYRHLYYFWVVAKEGGMARAAERLGLAVQTISTQVRELERELGTTLLAPAGRGLVLTPAGQVALQQAEQIFELGGQLTERVRSAGTAPVLRLSIGVTDALTKLLVHRQMQPVLDEPHLRLQCHVDEFDDLLSDLALHRLDAVLADRPAPANPNLRLYSHLIARSTLAWYAAPQWAAAAADMPAALARLPVLLPTGHAALRSALDLWFERRGITPRIVGEFEDGALLKAFGSSGMGVFAAAEAIDAELHGRYGVQRLGPCEGLEEQIWLIGTERRITHPLVQRLMPAPARP